MIATRGIRWASAAFVLLTLALGLALEWVPNDADQGFSQRIFYLHVPVALTAYVCFGVGAWKALRLLATGAERYDVESAVAVHIGTIFGALTLLTGSIWARISWGHWWSWSSDCSRRAPRAQSTCGSTSSRSSPRWCSGSRTS